MDEQAWESAIDQLYEAVGDGAAVTNALASLRGTFGAQGVALLSIPDSTRPQTFHIGAAGVSEHSLVEYHAHFNVHDEWVRAATARSDFGAGAIYRASQLVPAATLRKTYFWRAFLARYGVADTLNCVVEASTVAGPSTFVTFHRHIDQPPFGDEDGRRLARLAPHLRRTLRLHRRVAPALALGATLRELVERADVPLFFVAADGTLAETNAAAAAALADADACLRVHAGRLQLRRGDRLIAAADVLAQLLRSVDPAAEEPLQSPSGRRWILDVRRISGAYGDPLGSHPAVAICTLRAAPRSREAALRQRHGLTATEAGVAIRLAGGMSAAEVAEAMNVRISTVRTHIRGALAKTGSTRQAQLVAIVLAA